MDPVNNAPLSKPPQRNLQVTGALLIFPDLDFHILYGFGGLLRTSQGCVISTQLEVTPRRIPYRRCFPWPKEVLPRPEAGHFDSRKEPIWVSCFESTPWFVVLKRNQQEDHIFGVL